MYLGQEKNLNMDHLIKLDLFLATTNTYACKILKEIVFSIKLQIHLTIHKVSESREHGKCHEEQTDRLKVIYQYCPHVRGIKIQNKHLHIKKKRFS